jgi:hypothetical protein
MKQGLAVSLVGEKSNSQRSLVGKSERRLLEEQAVYERIILNIIILLNIIKY